MRRRLIFSLIACFFLLTVVVCAAEPGFLGIQWDNMSVLDTPAVEVTAVAYGFPAYKSGIQPGEFLLARKQADGVWTMPVGNLEAGEVAEFLVATLDVMDNMFFYRYRVVTIEIAPKPIYTINTWYTSRYEK